MLKLILLTLISAICLVANQPSCSDIQRSCNFSNFTCIRSHFESNTHCDLRGSGAEAPRDLKVPSLTYEVPFLNATFVDRDTVIEGLNNCYVSEFYYNTETGVAVTGINCPMLSFKSERVAYQHCLLTEDKVYRFQVETTYPLVRLTTTRSKAGGWNLCTAFTSADIPELPAILQQADDEESQDYADSQLPSASFIIREVFLTRAKFLARTYISSVFCDFGCEISKTS